MKIFAFLGAVALMVMMGGQYAAAASIRIVVDKSTQTMQVMKDGTLLYKWSVSTGTTDRRTPNGTFRVQSFDENHFSSLYNNAPMPHSIFYDGNRAIHGTTKESRLGSRDSKGCVRLSRANARILFALVQKYESSTRIVIQG